MPISAKHVLTDGMLVSSVSSSGHASAAPAAPEAGLGESDTAACSGFGSGTSPWSSRGMNLRISSTTMSGSSGRLASEKITCPPPMR